MTPVIKVENVSFSAGKNSKYILKNINFEVYDKDCIAIIGPNGAGKTTIFKLFGKKP